MTTWVDNVPPLYGPLHPQALYIEKLRPLLDRPGQWALIKSGTRAACQQAAASLKLRQYHIPNGEWEFTVRSFRRGVHVGSVHTQASVYARYLGEAQGQVHPYVAWDAVFNDDGVRVCPDCGQALQRPSGRGPWPKKCDNCWQQADTKWSRRKRIAQ